MQEPPRSFPPQHCVLSVHESVTGASVCNARHSLLAGEFLWSKNVSGLVTVPSSAQRPEGGTEYDYSVGPM